MIRVSVLYPAGGGSKFDMDYYLNKYMPMVQEKLGAALKSVSVENGLAGGAPGAPAPYKAIGSLTFDTVDEFMAAFTPHAGEIMADVANYTDIAPEIQVSDILK